VLVSWIRNLSAFVVALAAFAIGAVGANFALEVTAYSQAVEAAPEEMKVSTLASKGPGTKGRVALTNFRFGEPLIDKTGEKWDYVWIPLLAPSGKASNPVVFFRSSRIKNQAQLDELREQKTLDVIVANTALKRSVWGVGGVSKELYLKYSNIDFDKLAVVTEPDFEMPYSRAVTGKTIVLPADVLFSANTKNAAWGIGGGAILGGILLVLMMITPVHRVAVTLVRCNHQRSETGTSVHESYVSSIPPRCVKRDDVQRQRSVLATEHPVSTHQFCAFGLVGSTVGIGLAILAFLAIFGLLVYASSRASESGPAAAAGAGVIAASVFMILVYFFKRSLDMNGKSADVVQLCATGLRWQLGKKVRIAAWTEVAHVERVTLDVNRKKQVMASQFGLVGALAASMGSAGDPSQLTRERDTVMVQLQSGEVMFFSMNSLSEYNIFAASIHELHGGEASRCEGGIGHAALGRAFFVPGAASRATMFNNPS
jgi:hypothetical protein